MKSMDALAALGDGTRRKIVELLSSRPRSVVEIARELPVSRPAVSQDRKSTRLNSSHVRISYAVFCLKKKTKSRPTDQGKATKPPISSSLAKETMPENPVFPNSLTHS